jgi:hypothetical protein
MGNQEQGSMTFNYNMNFFMAPMGLMHPLQMQSFGLPFGGFHAPMPSYFPMMGFNYMPAMPALNGGQPPLGNLLF